MERLAKDGDPQALQFYGTCQPCGEATGCCEAHSLPRPLSKTRDKAEANGFRKVPETDGNGWWQDTSKYAFAFAFASTAPYTRWYMAEGG